MRQILFRAKRKDNGEWAEGDLLRETDVFENVITRIYVMKDHRTFIKHEVVPKTVSQYTGLTDRNGNRIWENDIVEFQFDNDDCPFPNKDTKIRIGRVFFSNFRSGFAIAMGHNGSDMLNNDLFRYVQNGNRVKIIGNVFDNPDLLEG